MIRTLRQRYAVNFDLSIAALRTHYSESCPKNAYLDIERYMKENGFSHRQWSGYISDKEMTMAEMIDFTINIHNEFPWLYDCEEKMDATVISDVYDLKELMHIYLEEKHQELE